MRRIIFLFVITLAACTHGPKKTPTFRFEPLGLRIIGLAKNTPVRLYNSSGKLILSYPPFSGKEILLIFRWKPNEQYKVVIDKDSYWVKAPQNYIVARLKIFAPLGQKPYEIWLTEGEKNLKLSSFEIAAQTTCSEIGILVENFGNKPLKVKFDKEEAVLLGEFSRKFFEQKLCFSRTKTKKLYFSLSGPISIEKFLKFKFNQINLSHAISLVSWHLPTDPYGHIEKYRREGTLVAPNPFWEHLGYLFAIKQKGFSKYDPFAYEALVFKNHIKMPLTLLLKAEFLDPKTKKPVAGFYPKLYSGHGFKQPIALLDLPPLGEAQAIIPVFLDKTISPGEYLAVVKVYPFGSKKPIFSLKRHFGVVRGSEKVSIYFLSVVILGLFYSFFVLFSFRQIWHRFKLRELILISLSGAVGFGLDFLGGMISTLLYALLGPFNILVGGLITEIAHYSILTAIVYLLPKFGTVTFSGLVTYFMGCLLLGHFAVTDVFFVGAKLCIMEIFLLVFRITKGFEPSKFPLVLALSFADAVNTISSLILHMVFYRLFFPRWYIILSVVIKGFLYTFIGALIGFSFGKLLKKVER